MNIYITKSEYKELTRLEEGKSNMKNRETFYFTIEELHICCKYGIDRKKMKKLIHQAIVNLQEKTEA